MSGTNRLTIVLEDAPFSHTTEYQDMTVLDSSQAVDKIRDTRKGDDVESLKKSFKNHLAYTQVKVPTHATKHDNYMALASMVRDRLVERWIATEDAYRRNPDTKRVYYLSLEFLMGRSLGNALINLELYDECYQALFELGYDLEDLRELEEEAGLGNGGLGRLAACFLDSMASLQLPGSGYGIRYKYGMFHQKIQNGQQSEEPDEWLRLGNPWEIARPEHTFRIQYYGRIENYRDDEGHVRFKWADTQDVIAMPYDMPIPGYRNNTVNCLRLFSAHPTHDFDLDRFNAGNYVSACETKLQAENITSVLYPKDDMAQGRELRLKQEFLLVSASLQDILHRFQHEHGKDWAHLPDHVAIQLNDTHPALAIPEMMRLLMDDQGLGWEAAWKITQNTFAYTNHTVMPEALEKWGTDLMGNLLPRHLDVVYEINRRFIEEVKEKFPNDEERVSRMSIIEEGYEQRIRMANLSVIGSHSVNGVSALHTEIIKDRVLHDFYELYPEKFNNKTNGITPRRWLKKSNPPLTYLIKEAIGDGWIRNLDELKKLEPFADDLEFRNRWHEVKQINKERLNQYLRKTRGQSINPEMMLDCQIKRIHDYKRQFMNLLHVITLYNRIKAGKLENFVPRTVLFGGKAAPGYYQAKLTIRLACAIADTINNDPEMHGKLHVIFPENYAVALAEYIIPAAELSEQISTAGMEASGTGNMKLSLNGALTIGTLDGANIEIKEEVGDENIFIFGLKADEIERRRTEGYNPWEEYHRNADLRTVIDQISNNHFSLWEPGIFQPLIDRLLREGDPYMVMADYASYIECQDRVSQAYLDQDNWTRMSILNTANMGKFSSDRTIQQYADEIWGTQPIQVNL